MSTEKSLTKVGAAWEELCKGENAAWRAMIMAVLREW